MMPAWLGVALASLAIVASTEAAYAPYGSEAQATFGLQTADPWDFAVTPNPNATSHLVFDTVNSFLQHWPNTRYRNGHNVVVGTVPRGTLLYHGTSKDVIPTVPEWTATDPEHSYLFCRSLNATGGCWHLTLVATRPLKVLYFDGSSAAKMPSGPMDTQDFVAWGEVKPDQYFNERQRIKDLCDWGKDFGVDGYVRMEMDFETMLCDFTAGVKPVSFLNLNSRGRMGIPAPRPREPPTNDTSQNTPAALMRGVSGESYRVIESGSWHNRIPGETRYKLDYSRMISFYDLSSFPSLEAKRFGQERWDHRLEGVTKEELAVASKKLQEMLLLDDTGIPRNEVDWQTLIQVVTDRYAERLEMLQYILNSTTTSSSAEDIERALGRAYRHVAGMLAPYILHSSVPPSSDDISSSKNGNYTWAAPVFEQCATTHTRYLEDDGELTSKFTPSEVLLLSAVKDVSKEICRILVRTWAEGEEAGLATSEEEASLQAPPSSPMSSKHLREHWTTTVKDLMTWLDWSYWIQCRPACSYEELCYLPTWPFFNGGPRGPRRPGGPHATATTTASSLPHHPTAHPRSWLGHVEANLRLLPDEDNDWERPQPRCIRRMEPFEVAEKL